VSDLPPTSAPAEAPVVWQQGLTVGRYSLVSRIAIGGMAEIWLARQVGLQGFEKFVVIKRIIDGLGADPEFVEMFLDEARIAAQLNHPHIVQIYDLGMEAGAYYIAMEYLPGEDLTTIVRAGNRQQKPLPIAYAVRIIADAAEGLGYAHAKTGPGGAPLGIVHRDVSPQNLLLTYDGQLKVVDFGIAKAATRESRTIAGHVKGKTAYMSPEQARGQPIDGRSDIFALGIILFELVTRTRLFQYADPLVALRVIASNDPIEFAHDRNPQVPLELSYIIAGALTRDLSRRYPTARAFQHALEEWLRSQPQVPGPPELGAYMSELFTARIQERALLLEQARNGELTSTRARKVMPSDTGKSMPGNPLPPEEVTALTGIRPRWPWAAGAAALLLVAGVGAALVLRPEPKPEPVMPVVLPTVPQPPAPPVLTIETDPPGAKVLVDGQEVGSSPLTLETLMLGEHTVSASMEGRKEASRQVTLSHPGERAMVVLALAPEPPPKPATDPTPTRPQKKVATGKLTLDTVPWTRVFLNGRKLGDTPLIGVSLPAGRHELKLVNEEKKISAIIEVQIRAGQTTAKKLRL
jgi:serine/threonine protein kinase